MSYFPIVAFYSAQLRDERGAKPLRFRDERSEVNAMLEKDHYWTNLVKQSYRVTENKKQHF